MRVLFQNVTFRRLFIGRLLSNAGDSLYYIGAMALVYDLGGSVVYTGLAGFLTLFPQALQFLTGPLVDRWSLRRVLIVSQLFQGLVVLIIPIAYWTGQLTITVVLVVMPIVAMASQFVYPAQSAAVPRIVAEDELVSANSAFSTAYQGTDAAFSALGGVLIAIFSPITAFVFDVLSFLGTGLLFGSLSIPPAAEAPSSTGEQPSYRTRLLDGLNYVRGTVLVAFIGVAAFVNGLLAAAMAVLPAFADGVGGSSAYGLLLAGLTSGLLLGALSAEPAKRFSLSRLIIVGFTFGGGCWLAGVAIHWLPATVVLFCCSLVPAGLTNVLLSAIVQTHVPEPLVGRVSSIMGSASVIAMPIGSLIGGLLGDLWGVQTVVAGGGIAMVALAVLWAGYPRLRTLGPVEALDPQRCGLTSSSSSP